MDAHGRVAHPTARRGQRRRDFDSPPPWQRTSWSTGSHQLALRGGGGGREINPRSQASNTAAAAAATAIACPFSFLHGMFLSPSWIAASSSHGESNAGIWERPPFEGNIVGLLGLQNQSTGKSSSRLTRECRVPLAEVRGSAVLSTGVLRDPHCTTVKQLVPQHQSLAEHHEAEADEGPAVRLLQHLQTLQVPIDRVKDSRSPWLLDDMLQSARLDCGSGAVPSESVLAASTSGRVDSEFWNERRKGRGHVLFPPTGVFYVVDPVKDSFAFSELEQGRKLEENVAIGEKHVVSTCFEQGSLGEDKSIWMSTSHKLDANNMLATHYANDLKGGADFTFNTSHSIDPDSRLSTCFHAASLGDPTLEVELEQERETRKVSESLLANLRTGDRLLRLQSKKTFKHNVALRNAYMTNLRGQHSVRLEASVPILGSGNISNSFTTDFRDSHEVCLKGQQRIGDRNTFATSFITNLNQSNRICVEAKHVTQGAQKVDVKLTNDLHGATQVSVTTSHTRQRNRWGWTYRRGSGEAQSVGVEWRHEVAPDKFISLRASARDWTCNLYAELRLPF